jgi:hypothetical protein
MPLLTKMLSITVLSAMLYLLSSGVKTIFTKPSSTVVTDTDTHEDCIILTTTNERLRCLKSIYDADYRYNTYKNVRGYMYTYVDNYDGIVTGVYGGKQIAVPRTDMVKASEYQKKEKGEEARQICSSLKINTEHIYPQSKLKGIKQKANIHNLLPASSYLNVRRSNLPFQEIPEEHRSFMDQYDYDTTNKIHKEGDYTNKYKASWEPRVSVRGDIVRAIAYMIMKYNPSSPTITIDLIKKWDLQDPVDQDEMDRMERASYIQGDINPFVAYPGLIQDVF